MEYAVGDGSLTKDNQVKFIDKEKCKKKGFQCHNYLPKSLWSEQGWQQPNQGSKGNKPLNEREYLEFFYHRMMAKQYEVDNLKAADKK